MDIERAIDNWVRFADQFESYESIMQKLYSNARVLARVRLKNLMLTEAMSAIDKTEEFQYGPLREALYTNLERDEHYQIDATCSSVRLLDQSTIGTFGDLMDGARAAAQQTGATGTGTQQERLYGWTWGIYAPAREGVKRCEEYDHYPTYDEIIDLRLSYWQGKAPYWYILNYGNAGGAPAYPTCAGTGFVEIVRSMAPGVLEECRALAARNMGGSIERAIEQQRRARDQRVTRVSFKTMDFGATEAGKKVKVIPHQESSGRVWYQLMVGGQFGARVRLGELLPTGERFTMGGF